MQFIRKYLPLLAVVFIGIVIANALSRRVPAVARILNP